MESVIDRQGLVEIFTPYITKNGKRIYPKNGKFFHFWVRPKDDKPPKPRKD